MCARTSEKIGMCVCEQVSHLQHLFRILSKNFLVYLERLFHLTLKAPAARRHEVERHRRVESILCRGVFSHHTGI